LSLPGIMIFFLPRFHGSISSGFLRRDGQHLSSHSATATLVPGVPGPPGSDPEATWVVVGAPRGLRAPDSSSSCPARALPRGAAPQAQGCRIASCVLPPSWKGAGDLQSVQKLPQSLILKETRAY